MAWAFHISQDLISSFQEQLCQGSGCSFCWWMHWRMAVCQVNLAWRTLGAVCRVTFRVQHELIHVQQSWVSLPAPFRPREPVVVKGSFVNPLSWWASLWSGVIQPGHMSCLPDGMNAWVLNQWYYLECSFSLYQLVRSLIERHKLKSKRALKEGQADGDPCGDW